MFPPTLTTLNTLKKNLPRMPEIRTSGYKKRAAKRWNFKEITLLGRPPMDKLNIVLFVK